MLDHRVLPVVDQGCVRERDASGHVRAADIPTELGREGNELHERVLVRRVRDEVLAYLLPESNEEATVLQYKRNSLRENGKISLHQCKRIEVEARTKLVVVFRVPQVHWDGYPVRLNKVYVDHWLEVARMQDLREIRASMWHLGAWQIHDAVHGGQVDKLLL